MAQKESSKFVPLKPKEYESRTYREGDMVPPQSQERIAHALEYIAETMGEIAYKLDGIIGRLDAQRK
jgi:hypothetical protein